MTLTLTRIAPGVVLIVLLILAVIFAARTPVHARGFCLFCPPVKHSRAPARHEFDPNFCYGVIKAFDNLHPKDLDTFISTIPEDRREQARLCMTDRK